MVLVEMVCELVLLLCWCDSMVPMFAGNCPDLYVHCE